MAWHAEKRCASALTLLDSRPRWRGYVVRGCRDGSHRRTAPGEFASHARGAATRRALWTDAIVANVRLWATVWWTASSLAVRGAFTGSTGSRRGLIQHADRGTLSLDEIDRLSGSTQPRLLRVLETQLVRPVGSDIEVRIDFRVVSAANEDLEALVEVCRFSQRSPRACVTLGDSRSTTR